MKSFNLEEAKAGAPVCTMSGEKARIIYFDRKDDYPIVAIVGRHETIVTYTIDGKVLKDGTNSRIDLMMDEKPEYQFKPFEAVLVRDDRNGKWTASLFSNIRDENDEYQYQTVSGAWKYCISYEGNEYLLGTTDMPKED